MHRPRLALLRQATGESHLELERLVAQERFFDSRARYGEYLCRLHLFYRRFTAGLAGNVRDRTCAWHVTERIGWLAQDIEALRLTPLPDDPRRFAGRPLADHTQALGALYVLLGASLGARVLIERTHALDLPAAGGQAYLDGVRATSRWNRFLDALEIEPISSTDALCRGALDTFASIRDHLSRGEPS